MNTYVVIVTYNGMEWIEKCLSSIPSKYIIIVVDNNSEDSTVDYINTNYPNVVLLEQSNNLGFGQANNLGIQYALNEHADYLFLLNQDAYIVDDGIQELINIHSKNGNYGILSPIHLNGNGDLLDKHFSYYLNYDRNKSFYSDAIIRNDFAPVYKVPFVNAAAWLIPSSTILKIGMFDKIFFHYGEDTNYCQRVNYSNLNIGVVPKSFIKHDRIEPKFKSDGRFSRVYFKNKERELKVIWADVNRNENQIVSNYDKHKNKLKKEYWLSFLTLQISKCSNIKKEIEFTKQIFSESLESRELNIRIQNFN